MHSFQMLKAFGISCLNGFKFFIKRAFQFQSNLILFLLEFWVIKFQFKGKTMLRSLYSATSGMLAQQTHIDTTSNNIANVNTTGLKNLVRILTTCFTKRCNTLKTNTSNTTLSPDGMEVGLGVRPSAITKMFSQGSPKETENNLDVAITGKGFFKSSCLITPPLIQEAGILSQTNRAIL